jgi:hypothetical protein
VTRRARLAATLHQADYSALAELAVLAAVLVIAATASYLHLREVWQAAGAPVDIVGPLSVDGLFAAAWLRMRRRRLAGVAVGFLAWVALAIALAATLAGNLSAAWISGHRDPMSLIVAAWPAIAFALVWELVTGHGRPPRQAVTHLSTPLGEVGDTHGETWEAKRDRLLLARAGRKRLAAELDISEHAARQLLAARGEDVEEAGGA